VNKKKIYQLVLEQIQEGLSDGSLQKGGKLPTERELAQKLQVSRASIREALRVLDVLGIITSRHGGGNFINHRLERSLLEPFSIIYRSMNSSLPDILEIREILESQLVKTAARSINKKNLAELKNLGDQLEGADNIENWTKIDKKIHYEIIRASKNQLLIVILNSLSELFELQIKNLLKKIFNSRADRADLIKQHKKIIKAIEKRDEKNAELEMKNHFMFYKKH
ncbi:MAG TPA: FadR family transcriptional regulator, partial [Spirochaetia bacterium]|nr:FadR family transcriptional regulator [Spirochaetia bacterium]